MLLQDLSRNKKACVGLILVALSLIYIVSKRFLFRTVLGRLLLVVGLVATTNCNKMVGLILLIVICLAYSQLCTDFENMENPVSTTPTAAAAGGNTNPKPKPQMPATPPTTSPDTATVEEKKRKMVIGKSASSLPTPPKDETSSAKDVTGATSLKESFLGFSRYY